MAVILIAVILYFVFRKPKQAITTESLTGPMPGSSTSGVAGSTQPALPEFPLQKGSKGDNVRRLQQALNRLSPQSPITVDGAFGNETATKIITTLATTKYSYGPKVYEAQLNEIIAMANRV